eukprot:6840917-Prymnesium_polylepis.2
MACCSCASESDGSIKWRLFAEMSVSPTEAERIESRKTVTCRSVANDLIACARSACEDLPLICMHAVSYTHLTLPTICSV